MSTLTKKLIEEGASPEIPAPCPDCERTKRERLGQRTVYFWTCPTCETSWELVESHSRYVQPSTRFYWIPYKR